MQKFFISCALLLWPFASANAMSLVEAGELLGKKNEEVVANVFEDRLAAQVVLMLQKGEKVAPEAREEAREYCADRLSLIATPKLRKKMVRKLMKQIDSEIENFVPRADGFEEFEGRMLSFRISKRLRSLLDFEAERYQGFLQVLTQDR